MAGQGTPAPSAGRKMSGAAVAHKGSQPPWARGIIDQLAAAQRQFDPSNATAVVEVMDHLPDVMEAMAGFMTAVGKKSVSAVDLPPGSQTIFLELGAFMRKAGGPIRTGLAAAKRSVADRIARYLAQRPQDAAWDLSANKQ
jgi:hypothetical protein